MTNPYAPPQSTVTDVVDPFAGFVLADRGTRLVAVILDTLIGGAMTWVPFLAGTLLAAVASGRQSNRMAGPFLVLGVIPALVGGIVWCWLTIRFVRQNGQTIGKRLLGVKVVRSDGSRASLGRIFWLRNVVNVLISVIPIVGFIYGFADNLFIFSESRQCLHDKIADTIVVKA